MTESLIYRLKRRAEIRRGIPRAERDRIADLLEEAATELERVYAAHPELKPEEPNEL